MVKDPVKLCFQHKIMQNTVLDKKLLSQPRLDLKRSFDKKWLILNKTQILTQNGVRSRKTVLSTQNNEKHRKTVLLTKTNEKKQFRTKNA